MIRSPPLAVIPAVPFIRRALPADVPAIVAIETEAFADPWDAEIFTEALSYYPTTYFVAAYEGTVPALLSGRSRTPGKISTAISATLP